MATEHDAKEAIAVELQVVNPNPAQEADHEALWFTTADGDRYCFYLPPGYTFNANPEISNYNS